MLTSYEKPWIIGITGASGVRYALRLLEVLGEKGVLCEIVISEFGLRVLQEEEHLKISQATLTSQTLLNREFPSFTFHSSKDIGASIASGSYITKGMVIIPCSMSSLASIAHGIVQNVIHRAADVTLKEKRPLIVVPRETPLSTIHLRNMLALSEAGAQIIPAMPGFYHSPQTLEAIIDMMILKVLDAMGIENDLITRWS